MTKFLLGKKAVKTIRDTNKKTAIDYARDSDAEGMAELFESD
jgi:hypothetical protein